MSKTIALGIKISAQGGEKVIKNVSDLEKEIKNLQKELKEADFGSEAYAKTEDTLRKLQNTLKDVNKQVEGLDADQRLNAIAGATNLLSGSFLLASSTLRTFGADSEDVTKIQELQLKATEAVNIALGLRAIAEGVGKVAILQRVVAEKAAVVQTTLAAGAQKLYTAAVGTSTGALKAFRTVLFSLGIGVVIALIGTLVANFDKLKALFTSSTKELDKFTKAQRESVLETTRQTSDLQRYVRVVNDTTASEKQRTSALEELRKAGIEVRDVNLENADSLRILNERIEQQIELIKLKAKEEALAKLSAELFVELIKEENVQKDIQARNNSREITSRRKLKALIKEENQSKDRQINLQKQINDLNLISDNNIKNRINLESQLSEETNKITEALQRQEKARQRQLDIEKERQVVLQSLVDSLKSITFDSSLLDGALEKTSKFIEDQNNLLNERSDILNKQEKDTQNFIKQLQTLVGVGKDLFEIPDEFNEKGREFVESIIGLLQEQDQQLRLSAKEIQELFTNALKQGFITKNLTEDTTKTLIEFLDTSVQIEEKLQQTNNQYVDSISLVTEISKIQQEGIKNFKTEREITQEIDTLILSIVDSQGLLTKGTEEQKNLVESTKQTLLEQVKVFDQLSDRSGQLFKNFDRISESTELIGKQLTEIEFDNLVEFIKANEDNLSTLKEFFSTATKETTALTKLQIDSINELLDQAIKTNKWNLLSEKILETTSTLLGAFQDLTNNLGSIIAETVSFQLEELQTRELLGLERIGNETQEQLEEQQRFRKEIAKERFEIEKRARVQELQFNLATGIAGGAQSIIQALALPLPPPGPQIIAGLYGVLTSSQIGVITKQLNLAKAQQFIGRRGGLIKGPSHEDGGVMAQGGLVLEGGEAVINRNAANIFGDLLSQINTSTGGRPLSVDDSALVQEIRRQNQRPIRTYVLDSDIQDVRKINEKLERIAEL